MKEGHKIKFHSKEAERLYQQGMYKVWQNFAKRAVEDFILRHPDAKPNK